MVNAVNHWPCLKKLHGDCYVVFVPLRIISFMQLLYQGLIVVGQQYYHKKVYDNLHNQANIQAEFLALEYEVNNTDANEPVVFCPP